MENALILRKTLVIKNKERKYFHSFYDKVVSPYYKWNLIS